MIKGCQKRMIHVKNTGCDLFDEAYFVLKNDVSTNSDFENDFLQTATAIINQNNLIKQKKRERKKTKKMLFFLLGFISGALPCLIFFFIL